MPAGRPNTFYCLCVHFLKLSLKDGRGALDTKRIDLNGKNTVAPDYSDVLNWQFFKFLI